MRGYLFESERNSATGVRTRYDVTIKHIYNMLLCIICMYIYIYVCVCVFVIMIEFDKFIYI